MQVNSFPANAAYADRMRSVAMLAKVYMQGNIPMFNALALVPIPEEGERFSSSAEHAMHANGRSFRPVREDRSIANK